MGLKKPTDNGVDDEGDVVIPVPHSRGLNAGYRRSTAPLMRARTQSTPETPPPSVREAQIIRFPLLHSPHIAQAAEKHTLSSEEITMLDTAMRSFTRLGFQPVEAMYGNVLQLQRPRTQERPAVMIGILRVAGIQNSSPVWKMTIASSDNSHRLNSFGFPSDKFEQFALEYSTRFQVDEVVQLDLDL